MPKINAVQQKNVTANPKPNIVRNIEVSSQKIAAICIQEI